MLSHRSLQTWPWTNHPLSLMNRSFTLALFHSRCGWSIIALVEQVIGRSCCRTDLTTMRRWLILVYDEVGLIVNLALIVVLLDHGTGCLFWHRLNKMDVAIAATQSLVVLIEWSLLCTPSYLFHTSNDCLRSIIVSLWSLTRINLMSLPEEGMISE